MQTLNFNAPDIKAPTLSSSAMLVGLTITGWSARKKDRRATADAAVANHANEQMLNTTKKLIASDKLDAIAKHASRMRAVSGSMTLPWADSGLRMLPTTKYFDYVQTLDKLRAEYLALVQDFIAEYGQLVYDMRAELGDLYDPDLYPPVEALAAKFSCSISYLPLPDADDFRLDIPAQALAEVSSSYASFYNDAVSAAMTDIWKRVHDALAAMTERLDYADDNDKKIFRDTLVTNVLDVIDVMADLNITNDAHMQLQQQQLRKAISGADGKPVTAGDLRKDAGLRQSVRSEVATVLANLPTLDF